MNSWGLRSVIPSRMPWEIKKGFIRASGSPFIAWKCMERMRMKRRRRGEDEDEDEEEKEKEKEKEKEEEEGEGVRILGTKNLNEK